MVILISGAKKSDYRERRSLADHTEGVLRERSAVVLCY